MNLKIHYVSGANNVLAMFRSSRDLTRNPSTIRNVEGMFGSPASVGHIFRNDNTGVLAQPLPDVALIEPHNRIWYIIHKNLHKHLLGKSLSVLADQFTFWLRKEIDAIELVNDKDEWTLIPDFHYVVQMTVFTASTKALCGPHIFNLNPGFATNFWAFNSHVPKLIRSLPKWMITGAIRARDKLISSIAKYQVFAEEHFDTKQEAIEPQDWEPFYGHRIMRDRAVDFRGMDGFNAEARAASNLGMIWA